MKAFIIALLALQASVALAQQAPPQGAEGGSGTVGGGESTDLNGRPSLRDLVGSTVCFWVGAGKFAKKVPHYQKILNSIRPVRWYMAMAYEHELESLTICETEGNLRKVQTEDLDAVTIRSDRTGRQAAIRLNNMIFIDMKTFKRMSAREQGYLLFHEVSHSFIPMHEISPVQPPIPLERRNHKLRSFVAAIARHEKQELSAEDLNEQISMNDMKFQDCDGLDAVRTDMETIFTPTSPP